MSSEQIFIDDKFVGEIIKLDEKWTVRIDYGYLEDVQAERYFYHIGDPCPEKGTFMLRRNPEIYQKVLDSFGKYDRYDSNIRRISLYENDKFVSDIFEIDFHD